MADESPDQDSLLCLVGNIVPERPYGEGGKEIRRGTKHFSPGTKVYCFPSQWGDGYEQIKVIGRHRGSKRFVTMIIRSEWVTNWRAKFVYNPEVLRRFHEEGNYEWTQEYLDAMIECLKAREGETRG
jgi:hypothetical protein